MTSRLSIVRWVVWSFLCLVGAGIGALYLARTLAPRPAPLPVYAQVPDFQLTNQSGQLVSRSAFRGHVWVANIIFTRCPGPCLEMTRKMKALHDALASDPSVQFVSLTADPDFDTPAVLKQYAARFTADPSRWSFLTGPKPEVYRLAMDGLKLAVQENPVPAADEGQFIHSTRFVVVDSLGQIRSVSSEGDDASVVREILRTVRILIKEAS